MSEATEEIKIKLLSYLDNVETFVSDQIPDLFQQILSFGVASGIISLICPMSLTLIGIFFTILGWKKSKDDEDWIMIFIVATCLTVVCFFWSCYNTEILLKIWLAPKLYLFDYIKGLR